MTTAPQPVVSIVIPTYNQADLLRDALASVLAQTETRWEAIVINNYSADHTSEVVATFQDPRIRQIDFHNEGVIAASRNIGIREASAPWIAFLDSDDLWLPDKLEKCLAEALPQIDVIGHALEFVRDGKVLRRHQSGPLENTNVAGLLYHGSCLTPSAALVRRDKLLEIGGLSEDREMITAEDYEMWIKLAKAGARFHIIDDVLTRYRLHDGNSSASVERHLAASLAVLDRHGAQYSPRMIRRARARYIYAAGRNLHKAGQDGASFRKYLASFSLYPFQPRLFLACAFLALGLRDPYRPGPRPILLAITCVAFVIIFYIKSNIMYFENKLNSFIRFLGLFQ